jgi:hypothetical protein
MKMVEALPFSFLSDLKLHIIYRQSLFYRDTADGALFTLLTACAEMQSGNGENHCCNRSYMMGLYKW